nr:uncharacterized protein LOC121130569 [Lepeophtheirus salmonis]
MDCTPLQLIKICDRHFTSNDFDRNLQAQLLDLKTRKKLKSDAVPSLHIPFVSPSSDEPKSSRDIRKETRKRKEHVKQLLEASKSLFQSIKDNGMKFILITHLNQDCLENVFSWIRAITGNNTHPFPVEALRRPKVILIGENHELVLRNPAV